MNRFKENPMKNANQQSAEQARFFKEAVGYLINKYYPHDKAGFHGYLIDAYGDADIGTGKYLLAQVDNDIDIFKHSTDNVPNMQWLLDGRRMLKSNPNKWFLYSSNIVTALTVQNLKAVQHLLATGEIIYTDSGVAVHA